MLVGTSNCKKLDHYLTGNAVLNIYVTNNRYHSGYRMIEASSKLEDVPPAIRDHTDFVVCHVGNCDLPVNTERDLDTLITRFELELQSMFNLCHNTQVIISGLPPRFGEERKESNKQACKMNDKLKQVVGDVDKAWYVDNYTSFTKKSGEVNESLYDEEDKLGIHLNEEGVRMLADNIASEISFVYFLDKQSKPSYESVQ